MGVITGESGAGKDVFLSRRFGETVAFVPGLYPDTEECVRSAAELRRAALSLDAMSLALIRMIADQRSYQRHGIIIKQHLSRFIQSVLPERFNHLRYRRMNRTSFLADRIFAGQTSFSFSNYVVSHTFTFQNSKIDIMLIIMIITSVPSFHSLSYSDNQIFS